MSFRRRALFLAGLFVAVSCSDAGNPLAPPEEPTPRPVPGPGEGAVLDCAVQVATGAMTCGEPQPDMGGASAAGLVVGGQNVKVRLVAANHQNGVGAAPTDQDTLQIDVTVKNLMFQALGTEDGSTLDPEGVRLVFWVDPQGQPGGDASIDNAQGSPVQWYFQYDTILRHDETSNARTWRFLHDKSVQNIYFRIVVQAKVQFDPGFVLVTPRTDTLPVSGTVDLNGVVYDKFSDTVSLTPTWTSSDPGVASVDGTGLVTANTEGVAYVKASYTGVIGGNMVTVADSALIVVNNGAPVVPGGSTTAVTNVTVARPAPGLLAGASDTQPLSVVAGTITSARGGRVRVNADGSFRYLSAADSSGTDSFQYQVTDGTRTTVGTFTVNILPSNYWFVQAGATGGDGRDSIPFGTIAAAQAKAGVGDSIIVLESGTALDEQAVLENGQGLIGAGIAADIYFRMSPTDSVRVLQAGLMPGLTRTAAGNTVQLAQNNVVAGLGISAANGAAIQGSDFGTLTTHALTVNPAGPALLLQDGNLAADFITLSSTGSLTSGLSLTNVTGALNAPLGTLAPAAGASGNAILVDSSSARIKLGVNVTGTRGIEITGVAADSVTLTGTLSLTGQGINVHDNPGGVVSFTSTADKELSTGANPGVTLSGNAAANAVRFGGGDLHVATSTGAGFSATGAGEVTVTSTDGDNAISITGAGIGLNLSGVNTGTAGITFARVSNSGAPNGIKATGLTGAGFQVTGVGGTGGTIANPTGRGIELTTLGTTRVELAGVSVTGAGAGGNAGFYADDADSVIVTGVSVSATGGPALSVSNGRLYGTFANLSSQTSATNGVILSSMGGRFTAAAGSIQNAASTGFAVAGGSIRAFYAGGISQTAIAAPLVSVAGHGTSPLDSLGFSGALSASLGTGLQFNNADGAYVFDGTAALNGGDAGIDVEGGSAGVFTFGTGVSVTNAANELIRVAGSAPNFTYNGSFSRTAGNAVGVSVQSNTGGTITFGGDGTTLDSDAADVTKELSTGTAAAVAVQGNAAGTTVTFGGGGLDVTTTSGAGLLASGNGTFTVTGAENTVLTGTGVAVDLTTVNTGAGVTLQSVSSNGAASGISLNGVSGLGIQVTGGGTIQNSTGPAVHVLNSTSGTSPKLLTRLTSLTISANNRGIVGTTFDSMAVSNVALSGTAGSLINLQGGALTGTFASVSGGTSLVQEAVKLTSVSGDFTVSGGNMTASTDTSIAVYGGSVSFTWAGGVTQGGSDPLLAVGNGHDNGTLTFQTGALAASGTSFGLSFDNADGTYAFNGSTSLTSSSATILLANGSDGAFTFGTGTTLNRAGGGAHGIRIIDSSPTFTYSGGVTYGGSSGMVVVANQGAGSITFNTGTLSTASGSGISLSNVDGTVSFNGATTLSNGPRLVVNGGSNGTVNVANGSGSASVSNGTTSGIEVSSNTSGLAFTYGGTVGSSVGRPVLVQNNTGGSMAFNGNVSLSVGATALLVDNNAGSNIDFTANVTTASGAPGIVVQENDNSTTVDFSGASKSLTTNTNPAVTLTNNTGATVSFTNGGLAIITTNAAGFSATGGGTVNVTGTANTVSSGTGTAINVVNTTIGSSRMTFRSVSASGGTNGIVLNNTGSSGGLTVTGTGSANSGGTIQNTSGVGVVLTTTFDPKFNNLRVLNTTLSGVHGQGVTNFEFTNGSIDQSGDGPTPGASQRESNILFYNHANESSSVNVTGTVTITGNTLSNALNTGVWVYNAGASTIDNLVISDNVFTTPTTDANSAGGGILVNLQGQGTNLTRATINNNDIFNSPVGPALMVICGNATLSGSPSNCGTPGSATNVITITNNVIQGQVGNPVGSEGIVANMNGRGQGNFNVSSNNVTRTDGRAIAVSAFGQVRMASTVTNNTIVSTPLFSGANMEIGADSTSNMASFASYTATVTGNNVSGHDGVGIYALARGSSDSLRVKIQNNTVAAPISTTSARAGIRIDSGSSAGDTWVCARVDNNTTGGSTNTGTGSTSPGINIRKQGTVSAVNFFGIHGLAGTPATGTAAATHVDAQNPGSTSGSFGSGGAASLSGSNYESCTLP